MKRLSIASRSYQEVIRRKRFVCWPMWRPRHLPGRHPNEAYIMEHTTAPWETTAVSADTYLLFVAPFVMGLAGLAIYFITDRFTRTGRPPAE